MKQLSVCKRRLIRAATVLVVAACCMLFSSLVAWYQAFLVELKVEAASFFNKQI